MANVRESRPLEVHTLSEIPEAMAEDEEAEFWASHSLGEELLDQMEPVPEGLLPPPRADQPRSADRLGEGIVLGVALTTAALLVGYFLYGLLSSSSKAPAPHLAPTRR